MTGMALVTGGSAGLGEALIRQLLARDMQVVCIDLNPPRANKRLTFIECDLADRSAVNIAWAAIAEQAPYDLVVFNAAVSATGRFEDMPAEAYRRLLAVNAETPMRLAAALMRESAVRSGGSMVFVSSLSHFTGYPGAAVYAASKDALAVYARSVRPAFRRKGVSVSCFFPGPIRTAHAARHAPSGADAERRMPASEAALALLAGSRARQRSIIPGFTAKLIAAAGRFFPRAVTRWMHREIFLKLPGSVY